MLFLSKNKKIGLGLIFGLAFLFLGGIVSISSGPRPDYAQAANLSEFSGPKLAATCTAGYYCSGSQRRYRFSNCNTTAIQNCTYGCSNGSCNPPPCVDDGTTCTYSSTNACDMTGNNNCGVQVSRCNRVTRVNGGWSSCSTTCGTGTKTCNNPTPACGGATCSGSSSCSSYIGCTYTWVTGTYSSCNSTTCLQTRTVTCQRSDGTTVADSNCTATKPATSASCSINGTWTGACTVTCGGGTLTCSGAACGGTCTGTAPACNTQSCFTYTLSASGNITAVKGSSGSNTITVSKTGGTAQAVTLSAAQVAGPLPTGVTAAFSPTACSPNTTCASTLTLSASASATTGTYTIQVSGSPSGGTTSFTLTVSNPLPTLSVALSISIPPPAGTNVVASADVAGTASGAINYSFWWNCSSASNSVATVSGACGALTAPGAGACSANANGYKCNGVTADPQTAIQTYSSGSYTAKVIAERSNAVPAEARYAMVINAPPPVPANLRVTTATPIAQGTAVNFAWDAASGATYYLVQFYPNGAPTGSWVSPSPITATNFGYVDTANLTSLGAVVKACKGSNNCSPATAVVTATITAATPGSSATSAATSNSNQNVTFNSSNNNIVYKRIDPDNTADRLFRLRVSGAGVAVAVVDQNGNNDGTQLVTVAASTDIIVRVSQGQTRYLKFTGPNGSYTYTFKRFRNFPFYEGQ